MRGVSHPIGVSIHGRVGHGLGDRDEVPVRRSAVEQATDTREYAVEMEIVAGGPADVPD